MLLQIHITKIIKPWIPYLSFANPCQKQPPEVFCKKRCAYKFRKIHRLRPAALLRKRLRHRCFVVNFAKFLGTSFSQSTSGWLFIPCVVLMPIFFNTSKRERLYNFWSDFPLHCSLGFTSFPGLWVNKITCSSRTTISLIEIWLKGWRRRGERCVNPTGLLPEITGTRTV